MKIRMMQQICARLDDDTVAELDAYVREREREARVPLSRSLGIREILERWATQRRVDSVDTARTASHK